MAHNGFSLRPRQRKAWVCVHVVVSVGWLGLDLALLVLGLTGLLTTNPEQLRAAYLAMGIFGDVLVVPIALATLVSGVVLSLGTRWGLVRYRWVLLKFVLTVIAATASVFALRPTIGEAVTAVSGGPAGTVAEADLSRVAADLVVAPSVALVIYTVCTAVSVIKPWGRTRFGRRAVARRAERRDRPAGQASANRPGRPGRPDRPGRPGRPDRPDRPDRPTTPAPAALERT